MKNQRMQDAQVLAHLGISQVSIQGCKIDSAVHKILKFSSFKKLQIEAYHIRVEYREQLIHFNQMFQGHE
jgi:hypothetical protein